jgi:hypothetical protein
MASSLAQTVGPEWRGAALLPAESWSATAEERPGGEAQGFFVECKAKGLRGYLKPTRIDPPFTVHPRAAHEKIASDLAFDLGLPVPPAILVDGRQCGTVVAAAVISLVMYPEVHKWSHAVATQAAAAIAHHTLRSTAKTWSGIIAFDIWLGNSDRNNDANLLIGTDPRAAPPISEPVFCDYANSMLHAQWTQASHQVGAPPGFLPVLLQLVDRTSALEMAERIKDFSPTTINEIVNRIPESYLLPNHKAIIVQALTDRRAAISASVASLLTE